MPTDTIHTQTIRAAAVRYAWEFLGLPYRWGGDDTIHGFDCSGLIIEVLQSVGLLPHGSDLTANGLYLKYQANVVATPYAGCLCLWTNLAGLVTHVEMFINDFQTLGASGGGSATTSPDAAAAQNAFIKIRPIGYRGSSYKIVDPFLVKP